MRRRKFFVVLVGALSWPLMVHAKQSASPIAQNPTGRAQSAAPTPQPSLPDATPQGSPPGTSAPVHETKETRESKEIKEIREQPSDWIGALNAIAWPFTVLILGGIFLRSKTLNKILGLSPKLIKKIKAGGIEMEINADVADDIRGFLRDSIEELLEKARVQYRQMVDLQQIDYHLRRVLTDALPRILRAKGLQAGGDADRDDRGTVHVQDIVFPQYLYQIVDYFPRRLWVDRIEDFHSASA
jgi:hypothetical protein